MSDRVCGSIRRSWLLLALVPLMVGSTCTPPCATRYYFSFHQSSEYYAVGSAEWNSVIDLGSRGPDVLAVLFFGADYVDVGIDPIELYDAEGVRADITGLYLERGRAVSGFECGPHGQLNYDISFVPNGTYTVVHRLDSVPGFRQEIILEGDSQVTIFDGEFVLATTLVLNR